MDDLISRQAAVSVIAKWMLEYGGEGEERERNALKQAAEEIKGLPSAQPEIIRCKECRYVDEDGVCQNSKGLAIQDDDDYCSFAERTTDECTD